MKYLTKSQYEILKCIEEYIKIHGYAPTYREIATITNRISTSTIYNHIKLLIKKGYLSMQEGCSRTITILVEFDENSIKKET